MNNAQKKTALLLVVFLVGMVAWKSGSTFAKISAIVASFICGAYAAERWA